MQPTSQPLHEYSPRCSCLECVTADRKRLRDLLDRRPAINAGLDEAFQSWTSEVYASDMMAHMPSSDDAEPTLKAKAH